VLSSVVKDRPLIRVKDLPASGQAVELWWPREAVRDHFATIMDTYRGGGAATWSSVAIDIRRLVEHATFATVRWNALDTEGPVVRDTETTYHLLADPEGCRFLSLTSFLSPTWSGCRARH
jgi:hypothetical protein